MFRRVAIVAASTVLVLVGSAAVLRAIDFGNENSPTIAQAPNERPGKRGHGLMRDLNLSADQMRSIQQIRSRYRDQLDNDRTAARQAQQELRKLMAGSAKDDEIRDKFRQVQSLRAKAAEAQFNSMLEMRGVLTQEQRQKFSEHMEKRRGEMRERFRDRMPGI
ncbi:putative Spy protein [Leptolyngbya boryana NIES-2135]|jgi:protein CpxP|uniref:Putative Spy protein n=1 Tax=Leptolyngbya boryana NIES-2135 TaxID=1973484 RepID=A0A1Z4JG69_LEPBY|nr:MULTISPECIES: Spy/CpxP family protein refolding chaperone [Leptolyngbya]BAY55746.1 putative Spy protein [Leptolyngbya boryana NIES-2135]MBD2370360.1 Spy/CpxP family protein refolding chaperone [Leptolyngbya sp. FACHB-161]MBD2376704.1 Spy/CpxP family protein refolding chaperone [Leptolyngbya sp. FACHB-238]MBD2400974.1 Spy/CpxP family protein refolding chaperone [Leptolyngbya sp. FACHB-239]MBD2407622.1 Spy/CpxP family protein refolding chaperone [Leptolyngbya sp. FACHB-402]